MDADPRLAQRLAAIAAGKPALAPEKKPATAHKGPQRRNDERLPSYKFGRIVLPGGISARCILTDLSASGARIAIEGATDLPETVILAIDQTGRRYRARVAWRRGHEAGLSFRGELVPGRRVAPSPAASDDIPKTGEIADISY
jgi:hypothetical protein